MATTALVVAGVGALASTAGSLYSGYQDKKAQEDQLEYLKSQAGMLGPLGMIFGGDNLQAIKDSYNKLLSEEGMSWLGSPEQANIGAFYAHIKPEERAFLDQIMAAALPRELRDVGIQRSLAAFEGRANRFAGAVGQGVGAVAGLPWNPTSFPTPSNAYIGNAVSDLGNSLMLMGMMGAGGGGGAPMSVGAAPNVGVTSAPVTAYQPALTATQPAPSLYSQYAPFGVTPSANTAGAFGGTVRRY